MASLSRILQLKTAQITRSRLNSCLSGSTQSRLTRRNFKECRDHLSRQNFRIDRVTSPISLPLTSCNRFSVRHGLLLDKASREDRPSLPSPSPSPAPATLRHKILSTLKSSRTPHEQIWNIPNLLTFSRLAAAPAVGYLILTSHPTLALALFSYAAVTDLIDGALARHLNQQTVVGTVIDPMADKALMTICVVALAMQSLIPVWLAALILGRDVGLACSAIYIRWISLPPPKTMSRYWDFSLPSAEVTPTGVSKVNTFLQLLLVGAGMVMPVVPAATVEAWHLLAGFELFQYLVAGTTVWSGASYAYSKDAWKILSRDEIEKRMKKGKQREEH